MTLYVDRRPIFTIGQIWFDFAKRLPRTHPRYKRDMTEAERIYAEAMMQASEADLNAIVAQQLAAQRTCGNPRQPYWGPIGAGIFGNYPSPYP